MSAICCVAGQTAHPGPCPWHDDPADRWDTDPSKPLTLPDPELDPSPSDGGNASERGSQGGGSALLSERARRIYLPDPTIVDLWRPYAPVGEEIHAEDLPDDVEPLDSNGVAAGLKHIRRAVSASPSEGVVTAVERTVAERDMLRIDFNSSEEDLTDARREIGEVRDYLVKNWYRGDPADGTLFLLIGVTNQLCRERDEARQRAASWWEAAKYNRRVANRRMRMLKNLLAQRDLWWETVSTKRGEIESERDLALWLHAEAVWQRAKVQAVHDAAVQVLAAHLDCVKGLERERDEARAKLDQVREVLREYRAPGPHDTVAALASIRAIVEPVTARPVHDRPLVGEETYLPCRVNDETCAGQVTADGWCDVHREPVTDREEPAPDAEHELLLHSGLSGCSGKCTCGGWTGGGRHELPSRVAHHWDAEHLTAVAPSEEPALGDAPCPGCEEDEHNPDFHRAASEEPAGETKPEEGDRG